MGCSPSSPVTGQKPSDSGGKSIKRSPSRRNLTRADRQAARLDRLKNPEHAAETVAEMANQLRQEQEPDQPRKQTLGMAMGAMNMTVDCHSESDLDGDSSAFHSICN